MTTAPARVEEVATPAGPARAHVWTPPPGLAPAGGALVLGHGAGGSAWSADLLALTDLAADGRPVVLVEQPWRVAGRRVAPAPPRLDEAWRAVWAHLLASGLPRPFVAGGRSAGARVACRTGARLGAAATLALAFPLAPPRRGRPPGPDRGDELRAAVRPLLVVQGVRDPFGAPAALESALESAPGGTRPGADVVGVPGAHSFGRDLRPVVAAVRDWLAGPAAAAVGECAGPGPR